MPRKAKGIHTSPETAGEQNMTKENLEKAKAKPLGDEGEYLAKVLPIYERSTNMVLNRKNYEGKWTEEELATSLNEFFTYCLDKELEPNPPLLRLWLNISRDRDWDWRTKDEGFKGDFMRKAYDMMESRYFSKLDKYAVSNIFKLKTVHGYVEPNKTETKIKVEADTDSVMDMVKKLGLDKKVEE